MQNFFSSMVRDNVSFTDSMPAEKKPVLKSDVNEGDSLAKLNRPPAIIETSVEITNKLRDLVTVR